MKKLVLFCLVFLISNQTFAQDRLPNSLFLDWDKTPETTVGPVTYPEYWQPQPGDFYTTANPSTHTIKYTPTVFRTTDAYEGYQALLMRSNGNDFPFGVAAGALMIGTYLGGTDPSKVIDWGKPWTGRPERFVGYYKYIPVDNDKCTGWIFLTREENGNVDTIAEALFPAAMESATVTNYTKFDIPFVYRSSAEPNTIIMSITSSKEGDLYKGGNGSEFYLDKIMVLYSGETSVNYTDKESAHFWVYPNPTADVINFVVDPDFKDGAKIVISDLNGRQVEHFETQLEYNTYDISHWDAGTYIYEIRSEGKVLSNGRFIKQ